MSTKFQRYVALGDSSTEGLDDPDGSGGFRGWSERLASHVASAVGELAYANLAIRGLLTGEVLDQQLAPALALEPDLATLFVGTNDVTGSRFDEAQFASDLERIQSGLRSAGATVVGFTLPDLTPIMPLARLVRGRVRRMNARTREVSAATGSLVVDFEAVETTADPRLWSPDRFHANAEGHGRIAAALAQALGLPGFDGWEQSLQPPYRRTIAKAVGAELQWGARYLAPWIGRSLTGRTLGDGLRCKYPELVPWGPEGRLEPGFSPEFQSSAGV